MNFTKEQIEILENEFKEKRFFSSEEKQEIARITRLSCQEVDGYLKIKLYGSIRELCERNSQHVYILNQKLKIKILIFIIIFLLSSSGSVVVIPD
ncbi:hypothetical protein Mgra_00010105 [Meloidogyne graminicola]|uniref:Homeobox domain-containing protein n=1 Tax=Meloidogyne graminicola TaxID=189291 RepID=A0A8S9Z643_9BILA|nr:hypothetical protein Mgra_00010105 [Meloidogyne graminicola]